MGIKAKRATNSAHPNLQPQSCCSLARSRACIVIRFPRQVHLPIAAQDCMRANALQVVAQHPPWEANAMQHVTHHAPCAMQPARYLSWNTVGSISPPGASLRCRLRWEYLEYAPCHNYILHRCCMQGAYMVRAWCMNSARTLHAHCAQCMFYASCLC